MGIPVALAALLNCLAAAINLGLPIFWLPIVYEGNIETQEWLYYEQDGMVVTLGNWLNGRLSCCLLYTSRCV